MRFKKGSKVEVMNKEVPADIISGNGHGYNVRYNGYHVRLRPEVGSQNWVTGDIVEVFDESSWKVATVLKILKGGRFLVRPHGFTREIRTHKTNIRAWISFGKISGSIGGVKPKICQQEDDRLQKRKRSSPFCSSIIESKKVKHVEKDGGQSQSQSQSQRRISGHSFEKSHNWRHASLASNGSKQDSGSAAFILEKAVGHFSIHLLQIRQSVAIWHLSKRLKKCGLFDVISSLLLFQASLDLSSLCRR